LAQWLETPPGRYLLAWEQAQLDRSVADIFGFHALQLGFPELDALRDNRMPHRWLAAGAPQTPPVEPGNRAEVPDGGSGRGHARAQVVLQCDFDALPFDSQSLDLVVLPHALELARDPHLALREVERVLMPEGKVVILGFNPRSLWGVRQWLGRCWRQMGFRPREALFLPRQGEFIGYRRMRDWLRLLSFEVEAGRFGCYAPPLRSQRWLARFAWMERVGERWWPVFGAVYCVVAVKRVRGMRLVGLVRQHRMAVKAAQTVVSHRQSGEPHAGLADSP